jgi:competence protein ComEC
MTEGAAPQQAARGTRKSSRGIARLWQLGQLLRSVAANQRQHLLSATLDGIEQRRLFVLLPFALIAGILIYRLLHTEPDLVSLAIGSCAVIAALHLLRWPLWSRLCIAAWIGFCALPLHGVAFGTNMLGSAKYGHYTMRIDAVVFDDGEAQRWLVSEIVAEDSRDDPGIRRARLAAPGGVAVQPGDALQARVRFYPVPAPILPGGYDAQFAGYFDGIGAYGTVLGEPMVTIRDDGGLFRWTETIRRTIAQRLLQILDQPSGGIAIALVTGNQSWLQEEQRDLMSSVGLAHVLAISGLHLTLVAGTMFFTLRALLSLSYRLPQHLPVKRIAAAGGIAVAIAYLIISGMGIAAIRATIMLTLIFAAITFARQALTMRNVAIAALVIALADPASIFRASFQLSFAAVIALIAAYELARDNRENTGGDRHKAIRLFMDIAMTSLIAGLATLIFTAYHFQQTAPFGILGNLLAMPIVTFVMMPSALLATLLIPFGLDVLPFQIMGWSIDIMLWCAQLVRSISGGFDPSPLLAPSSLLVCLAALGWLAFFKTRMRLVGPALAVPVIFLFCLERSPDVLIADSTQALAVRSDRQLALMAGRTNTFATNVWSERYMETILPRHETTGCDANGCILQTTNGLTIALARDPSVFAEDCTLADLVVTRIKAPVACNLSATVIDAGDLARYGTHVLYWNPNSRLLDISTAITDTARPWRIGSGN